MPVGVVLLELVAAVLRPRVRRHTEPAPRGVRPIQKPALFIAALPGTLVLLLGAVQGRQRPSRLVANGTGAFVCVLQGVLSPAQLLSRVSVRHGHHLLCVRQPRKHALAGTRVVEPGTRDER